VQLGIFTFYVPGTVDETARRIKGYGFDTVQLNLEFKDWRFDDDSSPAACRAVREMFRGHGLSIAAISGYLNPIARDPTRRRANLDRMKAIQERARELGSPYVATETGSLHPHDDWAPHPDNERPRHFSRPARPPGTRRSCRLCGAVLLMEPVGNVVDTPAKAALMEQVASPAWAWWPTPQLCRRRQPRAHRRGAARHVRAPRPKAGPREGRPRIDGPARASTTWATHALRRIEPVGRPRRPELRALSISAATTLPDVPLFVEHLEEADVARAKAFVEGRLTVPQK
jgi:hypothetical protein